MKNGKITIEVPMPDEATEEDLQALADLISRTILTGQPTNLSMQILAGVFPKIYGRVVKVTLK